MFLSISIKARILSRLKLMTKSLHFLTSCDVGLGRELDGVSRRDKILMAFQQMQISWGSFYFQLKTGFLFMKNY